MLWKFACSLCNSYAIWRSLIHLRFADQFNFKFEFNTKLNFHYFACLVDQRTVIGSRPSAAIHEKIAVRGRNDYAADASTLQSGSVDQPSGNIVWRIFEHAS